MRTDDEAADPTDKKPDGDDVVPPAIPIIQALALLVLVAIVALDYLGGTDFSPPREAYAIVAAAILGLGPESAVRLANSLRGKPG